MLRFEIEDKHHLVFVTTLAAWIHEDGLATLFDRLYLASCRIFHQTQSNGVNRHCRLSFRFQLRIRRPYASQRTRTRSVPSTEQHTGPCLIWDDTNVVLHIISANMAISACMRCFQHSRSCKTSRPPQSATYMLQTGSRSTISLFISTEHRTMGFVPWRVARRSTAQQQSSSRCSQGALPSCKHRMR